MGIAFNSTNTKCYLLSVGEDLKVMSGPFKLR